MFWGRPFWNDPLGCIGQCLSVSLPFEDECSGDLSSFQEEFPLEGIRLCNSGKLPEFYKVKELEDAGNIAYRTGFMFGGRWVIYTVSVPKEKWYIKAFEDFQQYCRSQNKLLKDHKSQLPPKLTKRKDIKMKLFGKLFSKNKDEFNGLHVIDMKECSGLTIIGTEKELNQLPLKVQALTHRIYRRNADNTLSVVKTRDESTM